MYTEAEYTNMLLRASAPTIVDAVRALTSDASWSAEGTEVTFHSGTNLPTQEALEDKLLELQTDWQAAAYMRDRAVLFAAKSAGEQFDMIYWDQVNNTTLWRDWVAGIKAAYPKPAP